MTPFGQKIDARFWKKCNKTPFFHLDPTKMIGSTMQKHTGQYKLDK